MLTVQQATDFKERGVRVICMNPGWVKTRMGGGNAALEPKDSISGMLKVIQGLKDDETAKFYSYNGEQLRW
jgi:NAD(P)-dependent dehydrogenase (short-subunit alcohol dehydrogenase family)